MNWTQKIPTPIVCDPGGDGNPLVFVTDQGHEWLTADRLQKEFNAGTGGGGLTHLFAAVLALDGKSGQKKWSWCGEGFSVNHNRGLLESAETWRDASPQIVRTAAGPAIVVSLFDESLRWHVDPKTKYPTPTNKSGSVIVLLSDGGKVLRKIEDESPDPQANFVNFPPVRPRLWVHDLLGNGQDGLVWYDGRRVRAMQATAKGMLWEWERPTSPTATGYLAYPICGIQPAGKGFPATIAVASFNGMVGLAGPTGKVRWRCDDAHVDVSSVLDTDDPQGLPRILSLGPGSANELYGPRGRRSWSLRSAAAGAAGIRRIVRRPPPSASASLESAGRHAELPRGLVRHLDRCSDCRRRGRQHRRLVAGQARRAAWLFGLWFVPSLVIETIRFVLENRELGPNEHFDWSNWWAVSMNEWRIVLGILLQIVIVWWIVRLVWWSVNWIRARLKRTRKAPA